VSDQSFSQDPPTDEQPSEIGIDDALRLAIGMHRAGQLDDAEKLYKRIIEAAPDHPDAMHYYGLMLHHRYRSDAGLALIERSIALDPTPGRYNNLGNALVERERVNEAIDAYAESVKLHAQNADAYNNLGLLQRSLGHIEEAEAAYAKALEADPNNRMALVNLGNLHNAEGRYKDSVQLYWKALSIDPKDHAARRMLGFAYYSVKEYEAAADVFRIWLQNEPGSPTATHMLAACTGVGVPARGADQYIEELFDRFATSFDSKLEQLEYRAPQLVADAVGKVVGAPAGDKVILDAGCGTGLCGPLLAPYASRLVGVDLSNRMLDGARVRGVYHELEHGELTAFIAARPDSADVIVSADTLCYFGPLDEVLAASSRALRPGGCLVFSVEAATVDGAPAGHRMNPNGRYSHTREYLERDLAAAGLAVASIDAEVLRTEGHEPVHGFVVTARKAAP
jgi:predicted TPR repeat methyltransferase